MQNSGQVADAFLNPESWLLNPAFSVCAVQTPAQANRVDLDDSVTVHHFRTILPVGGPKCYHPGGVVDVPAAGKVIELTRLARMTGRAELPGLARNRAPASGCCRSSRRIGTRRENRHNYSRGAEHLATTTLIDRLCSEQRFVSMAYADGMEDAPVIGTVERRPAKGPESLPPRRPVVSESSTGMAAEVRQRS